MNGIQPINRSNYKPPPPQRMLHNYVGHCLLFTPKLYKSWILYPTVIMLQKKNSKSPKRMCASDYLITIQSHKNTKFIDVRVNMIMEIY